MKDGVSRFCLQIGDVDILLSSRHPELRLTVDRAAEAFRIRDVADVKPDIAIEVRRAALAATERGNLLFDSGSFWQLYREADRYTFRFCDPSAGSHPFGRACFDAGFTSGELTLAPAQTDGNGTVDPLASRLGELVMTHFLARGRGAVLHSCGVIDPSGQGYLFVGNSGTGKTTTARLWATVAGALVLSDDRMILRQAEETLWMYGTPWCGERCFAAPGRAPVKKVFFLRHGSANERSTVPATVAAARLFASSFLPLYDPEAVAFALGFCDSLVRRVACEEFAFVPNQNAVAFVRSEGAARGH